ncbi:MAG: hypothetical protein KJS97_15925, partial [Alphaproteobacteria bacterium]|nr:hypothetical protein [Alphaproteobacteria bacterium]
MIEKLDAQLAAGLARMAPTPRERALLAVLGAAVAVVATVQAATFAADQHAATVAALADASRADAAARAVRDPARRATLESSAETVRARAMDDATFAIAAVRAQTDLEGLAREAGLGDVRASVLPGDTPAGAAKPVRVALEASFEWSSFDALLGELKGASQSYVVE